MEHEINKEITKIEHHCLNNHLREMMLKVHKHLMKIHCHHNFHYRKTNNEI